MIKVKNLTFRYSGSAGNTLDGIDLRIKRGEWVVIQGDSGCGKTTLALALSGFLYNLFKGDYQGHIEVNGAVLEEMDLAEAASRVYLVQQNPENQFCTLTVRDELAFGLENRNIAPGEIQKRIHQALVIVHGETLLDANLLELSGGEKQKVAIATAIAMQPEVLILDEPTSNLDPVSSKIVFKALNELKKLSGMTVVIIEHKIQQLRCYHPRILKMQSGKIIDLEEKESAVINKGKRNKKKEKLARVNWEPILELENFVVKRQDQPIISIHDLVVYPGEIIALMGPNGSGKSTFLLGLLGLLEREFKLGRILQRELRSLKTFDITQNCGYVFQNPDHQLFCSSLEEELFMAARNFDRNRALSKEDASALLSAFRLNTDLWLHPQQLSFGQKKRLNLASVLVHKPRLLLLDEIFIGQDQKNIDASLEILEDYVNQTQAAVLIVNHYIQALRKHADRVLFFDRGEVLFDVPLSESAKTFSHYGLHDYMPENEQ